MCAICLCPYEEGDIRIFSKRCTHAFHKECILEWLVKGHNECPCCRIDIVTKNEIREKSASLMGTERLAKAMAVVDGSEMQEAPPFRSRVRRPRLARQMIARARALHAQAERRQHSGDAPPSPSPNTHWLWTERHSQPSTPLAAGQSYMPPLNEGDSSPTTSSTPGSNNGAGNIRNRDWLWATRFDAISPSVIEPQPRTINPSRSSDAIMNPHESSQTTATATVAATPTRDDVPMHNTTAGSLFSSNQASSQNESMFHDHWQQRSQEPRRRTGAVTLTLSPNRRHDHWRQMQSMPDAASDPTSPGRLHNHWRHIHSTLNSAAPNSPIRRHPHWRQGTASQSSHSSNLSSESELPVTVLPAI